MAGAAAVLDQLTGCRPVLDEERHAVGVVATRPRRSPSPGSSANSTPPGCRLLDVNLRPPTLDEVFLRLTDGSTARPVRTQ